MREVLGTLLQDVRYALRGLLKRPGFTAVAIGSLALGIGANTSIFSVVNAVLLRPLSYPDSKHLMVLWETNSQQVASLINSQNRNQVAPGNFVDWNSRNHVFEGMAAVRFLNFNLTATDSPERIPGAIVSPNFFSVMGMSAAVGRTFQPEDTQSGNAERVVVLSQQLWQRRFGSNHSVTGQKLTLNNETFSIIGVMPAGFQYPEDAELWVPARLVVPEPPGAAPNANPTTNRLLHYLLVVGRLKPEVTPSQAQAEMNTIAANLQKQYPDTNGSIGTRVAPMQEEIVGDIKPKLRILLGVVGLVLLIACANLANLLLARGNSIRREIALRLALGARRSRVIRQLMTESIVLGVLGGIVGLLLAYLGIRLLVSLSPTEIPRLDEIGVDGRVLAWTLVISFATGLISGLVPALQSSKPNLNETLQEGGRGADTSHRHRVRSVLVVAEVALTLILLVGAGLLIKSFKNLQQVDAGFRVDNVLTMRIALPAYKYPKEDQSLAFTTELIDHIKNLPGVTSVGITTALPLSRVEAASSFTLEGHPVANAADLPLANWRVVSPEYFGVLGIPVLQGRTFTERDNQNAPKVVLINQALVRTFFANEDPIGKRLVIGTDKAPSEIVGVVGDVRHSGLDAEFKPEIYGNYLQTVRPVYTLVVRTQADPSAMVRTIRNQVQSIDKDQPVYSVKTMKELRSESLAELRFNTYMLTLFATVALLLAAVGIYGVISYATARRTHEIGIRMALGAQPLNVLKLVLGHGMILAGLGIIIGLAASFALTRVLTTLLYSVSPTDPLTFVLVSILLALVALFATYIPARRATRVDPTTALRHE